MKVVVAAAMRALDRRAMEEAGIPGVVLMENAGRAVFEVIADRFGPIAGLPVHLACGTGNNGGDGFVAARYLKLAGAAVTLSVAGESGAIRGDSRTHFELLHRIGIEPTTDPACIRPLAAGVVVDALLGTGAKGAPRGRIDDAVRAINSSARPVVAIDVPSGVDSDTGAVSGDAITAAVTVTFAYPKLGLFLPPGADHAGDMVVSDIGFDWESLHPKTPFAWLRAEAMRALLPPRPRESNKGMFGHLLVVGGSAGMSGAPTMAARAALRTGAGLVTVAAPASAQRLIASKMDEAMTVALPELEGALSPDALGPLRDAARGCDALCLGPGATQQPGAKQFLLQAPRVLQVPMVLDADGLNALAEQPDALDGRSAPAILTPHPGECARLLGTDISAVQSDRVGAVRRTAERYRAVAVLKGARTLICDGRQDPPDLPVSVNTTGNPGMATGGSGDTLTGIIGALLASGRDAYEAACLGVYLHGAAGDLAAQAGGEQGMVAGDIAEQLPAAIRQLGA